MDIIKKSYPDRKFLEIYGLPNIKQITKEGLVLGKNGSVYRINRKDLSFITISNLKDITQIITTQTSKTFKPIHDLLALDISGDVYKCDLFKEKKKPLVKPKKIKELKNIIEISEIQGRVVALDEKMKLHTYKKLTNDYMCYDLSA